MASLKKNKSSKETELISDKRIGNQFWKLRSKHGRDKLFKTPELLWQVACEYFQWCEENPILSTETKTYGKGIKEIKEIPHIRPFTLMGLCIYLNVSSSFWREFRGNLKENEIDFLSVVTRIEEIIYTQKFEGAAVGIYNSNIIARDLGLKDKSEIDNNITDKKAPDLSQLTYEQLKELQQGFNK